MTSRLRARSTLNQLHQHQDQQTPRTKAIHPPHLLTKRAQRERGRGRLVPLPEAERHFRKRNVSPCLPALGSRGGGGHHHHAPGLVRALAQSLDPGLRRSGLRPEPLGEARLRSTEGKLEYEWTFACTRGAEEVPLRAVVVLCTCAFIASRTSSAPFRVSIFASFRAVTPGRLCAALH